MNLKQATTFRKELAAWERQRHEFDFTNCHKDNQPSRTITFVTAKLDYQPEMRWMPREKVGNLRTSHTILQETRRQETEDRRQLQKWP